MTVKIAGAPISWGVCEVPGWGAQMSPDRVLAEMAEIGLSATEFGPEGFLPDDANGRAHALAEHGLSAVGGFVPVVLHDPAHDPMPEIERTLDEFLAAGADVLVLAAATGLDGYDSRPVLDDEQWSAMLSRLDAAHILAESRGARAVIHPHVGTMVETESDVERVESGSQIGFCLDTGHMFIGGTEPEAFVRQHAARIAHAHLKDVDLALARRVREKELTYYEAVIAGMYRPLGQGDVGIGDIVQELLAAGFDGWFVLEQDLVLHELPEAGSGPVVTARESADFLRSLLP